MLAAAAVAAEVAAPDGIELLDERIDEGGIVGQDAILKVALAFRFRAHPRAGKVRGTEVCLATIHDDALEMDARTEHPLHSLPQTRIPI